MDEENSDSNFEIGHEESDEAESSTSNSEDASESDIESSSSTYNSSSSSSSTDGTTSDDEERESTSHDNDVDSAEEESPYAMSNLLPPMPTKLYNQPPLHSTKQASLHIGEKALAPVQASLKSTCPQEDNSAHQPGRGFPMSWNESILPLPSQTIEERAGSQYMKR